METDVPLSLDVKRARSKADLMNPSDAEVKDEVELYLFSTHKPL